VDRAIVSEIFVIRVDPDFAPPNYLVEVLARFDRRQQFLSGDSVF
jgi:hypothetical protein